MAPAAVDGAATPSELALDVDVAHNHDAGLTIRKQLPLSLRPSARERPLEGATERRRARFGTRTQHARNVRAERSPSAKSDLLNVNAMTTPCRFGVPAARAAASSKAHLRSRWRHVARQANAIRHPNPLSPLGRLEPANRRGRTMRVCCLKSSEEADIERRSAWVWVSCALARYGELAYTTVTTLIMPFMKCGAPSSGLAM